MINETNANRYCKDSITEIENFRNAIDDKSHTWVCHHRIETDSENPLTSEQLIQMNMYYDRPASELIFLNRNDHAKLHGETTHCSSERKTDISNQMNQFYHDKDFKKQKVSHYRKHKNSGTVQLRGKTYLGIWVINGIRYTKSTHTNDRELAKKIVRGYVENMIEKMNDTSNMT